MNERDMQRKKASQSNIKSANQKNIYHKIGPACKPKQPPNISNFYQLNQTKKKQHYSFHSKELRLQEQDTQIEIQMRKTGNNRIPRTLNHKFTDEGHAKKKTKESSHFSKQKIKSKFHNKQNRQNKDMNSYIDLTSSKYSKISKKDNSDFDDLSCKESIKVKKICKVQAYENMCTFSEIQTGCKKMCKKNVIKKSFSEEIRQFEQSINHITIVGEIESLFQIFSKQQDYSRIQNYNCYLQKKHPEITWTRRAIVVNWMMEMCRDFSCKREVFALSVNYLDRYLTVTENIPLKKLQIVACGALSLANKNEDEKFRIPDLVELVGEVENQDLVSMECEIAFALKFRLHPPTTNMWANRIALQWDMHLDHNFQGLIPILSNNWDLVKFKNMENKSYHNYRSLMSYIDFSLLDVHTLQYNCRELSLSFIFIILLLNLKLYTKEQILSNFPKTSQYILEKTEFNKFYSLFLSESFGVSLIDLLPTIQYCSSFIFLKIGYELPSAAQGLGDDTNLEYEQFCSFQTCNNTYLVSLKERNRQYD